MVRAIVVLREREPSDDLVRELQDHCKRVAAPYKFPRIVEFADELPKTASGKIKRAELRASEPPAERSCAARPSPPSPASSSSRCSR